jgi:N-acetylglucosamine kinase-like BadF-type ATPase
MAGAARPAIDAIVRSAIAEMYSGEVVVVGDMVIAMEAAFGNEPGVIVIAGTGSIAYGRNSSGKTLRAGGWGFAISDEGSGHWIGRAAISAVMWAQDESDAPPGTLAQAILRAWKLITLDDLARAANSPGADFSLLCPSVIAAAEGNDPLARAVLTQAGGELARLAAVVTRRLGMEQDPVPVAMSGGVFRNSALVRNVFSRSLQSDYPKAVLRPEVVDPVAGALRLSRAGALKK